MNNIENIRNHWVEIYNKKFEEQGVCVNVVDFDTFQKELDLICEFLKDLDSIV